MDNLNPLSWNLRSIVVIAIGLGLALGLGYAVGQGDFNFVGAVFSTLLFFTYLLFWQRSTWWIALLIACTDLFYSPLNFNATSVELSFALGALLFAVTWWRKSKKEQLPILEGSGFSVLNVSLIILLIYGGAHCWFNIANPFRPEEYALKNLAKTYVLFLSQLALLSYFINRSKTLTVTTLFPYRVAQCLAIGLWLNIGLRIHQMLVAGFDVDTFKEEDLLRIPVLGGYQNIFALRGLAPLAALFAFAYIGTPWYRALPFLRRLLFWLVLAWSILGALLSGGRATVVFVIALIAGVLIYHRRIHALMACVGAMIVVVATVNVVPEKVEKLPFYVQRSVNWFIFTGGEGDVRNTIAGSSDWRKKLFYSAIAEWKSDPRIFWFGRATYRYTEEDEIAQRIDGEEGMLEISLRRGATHNLLSDLLVIFGLVGCLLYFWVMFAIAYFLWKIMKSPAATEISSRLAMVCLVYHLFTFSYGLVGGTNFTPALTWLMIMLMTSLYQFRAKTGEEKAPAIKPPRTPRGRPLMPARAMVQ